MLMKGNIYFGIISTILTLLPAIATAQTMVALTEPGTLYEKIGEAERYTIEELTVSGPLNGTDLRLLRDMAGNNYEGMLTEGRLAKIDLSEATLVAGGENYLECYQIFLDTSSSISDSRGFIFCGETDTVPQWLFVGCNSLQELILPKSAKAIGEAAFNECMLTAITIPSGVTSIGERAFYHNIYLKELKLPNALTEIGPNAFTYCTALTEIDIPGGVAEIGKNAFSNCKKLTAVRSHMINPCSITAKTFAVYDKATLYVPVGCKEDYLAADTWNSFTQVEEFEATRPNMVRLSIDESCSQATYFGAYDIDLTGRDDLKAYVATGYNAADGVVALSRLYKVPAKTGVLVKGDAGNYNVPVVENAVSCCKNMFRGTLKKTIVNADEDDRTNYYLDIDDDGITFYKEIADGTTLEPNAAYLSLPKEVEATESADGKVEVMLNECGQQPYSSEASLDFSRIDDLKAYTATAFDSTTGTIWLSRVKEVPAGTGFFLKGEAGKTYEVPTCSSKSVFENMMVANLDGETVNGAEGDNVNFYFSAKPSPGFYSVSGSIEMSQNSAYLQLPLDIAPDKNADAGTEGLPLVSCEETEVMEIILFGTPTTITTVGKPRTADDSWFDLLGRRINQPTKAGIYIKNGKKVSL